MLIHVITARDMANTFLYVVAVFWASIGADLKGDKANKTLYGGYFGPGRIASAPDQRNPLVGGGCNTPPTRG